MMEKPGNGNHKVELSSRWLAMHGAPPMGNPSGKKPQKWDG
jgi:hypothetical protein